MSHRGPSIQDILSRDRGLLDFGLNLRERNLTDCHDDQVRSVGRGTGHTDPKGLFVPFLHHHEAEEPLLEVGDALGEVVKLDRSHEAGDGQCHDSTCNPKRHPHSALLGTGVLAVCELALL